MNYECLKCKHVFDEYSAARFSDSDSSEFWGSVAVQRSTYLACPVCGCDEMLETSKEVEL